MRRLSKRLFCAIIAGELIRPLLKRKKLKICYRSLLCYSKGYKHQYSFFVGMAIVYTIVLNARFIILSSIIFSGMLSATMQIVPFKRALHEQFLRDVFGRDWGSPQHQGPRIMTAGDLAFTMPRVLGDSILVAEEDAIPVGFITYLPSPDSSDGHWQIRMLYVTEAMRGRGYGTQLIDFAVHAIRNIDYPAQIWLYVRKNNYGAQRLYQSLGFERRTPKPLEQWYVYTLSPGKELDKKKENDKPGQLVQQRGKPRNDGVSAVWILVIILGAMLSTGYMIRRYYANASQR